MAANSFPDDKKVPLFLAIMGRTMFTLLQNLMDPNSPIEQNCAMIVVKLKSHFELTPINIVATSIAGTWPMGS